MSGSIPRGVIKVNLRDRTVVDCWAEVSVLCDVEVMMVCFTKESCRIRGTVMENKGGYTKGEKVGNIDTGVQEGILKLIRG